MKLSHVDVDDLSIDFPNSGLVVAIEFMVIESNKFELKIAGVKDSMHVSYSPSIGVVPADAVHNSVVYGGGKWRKSSLHPRTPSKNREKSWETDETKFTVPAIMLTLSN